MEQLRVLGLVGSISKNSINRKLFGFVKDIAGDEIAFDLFDIAALPFFSVDIEKTPTPAMVDFKSRIAKADGILIVTPEHNRSFPAPLKNALDCASRPSGQNSWDGKPAGIMGASPGAIGTFGAQAHLRNVLSFLNMPTLPQPEFYFNFSLNVDTECRLNESSKEHIAKYLGKFKTWIRAHSPRAER
jgi:chromate reductase